MSLHGDVRVNGAVLHSWTARRIDDPPAEVNDYEVEVWAYPIDAAQPYVVRRTTISHRLADGALVLAAKVLAWASGQEQS